MNTTNILLATTSILIVVAFGLSFQGFSENRDKPENQESLALLKKEIEQIAAQNRALELTQLRAEAAVSEPTPDTTTDILPVAPGTATSEIDDDKMQELEATIAELEEANLALEEENETTDNERNEIKRKQTMAANRVRLAMNMGTVISANKESGFVIFKPSPSAPTHQPGKLLSIRRNSGILGEIQVDRLDETGQYIATMRPQVFAADGYPDIREGDEVIVNPNP